MSQLDAETPASCYPIADTAKLLKQWRVDLQLSGHTRGQVMIPGVGPVVAFTNRSAAASQIGARWVPFMRKTVPRWCDIGNGRRVHQVGTNQLYNRGLGTYLPGRYFVRQK